MQIQNKGSPIKLLTAQEIADFKRVTRRTIEIKLQTSNTPFELKKVAGVKQKVRFYKYSDLPEELRLDLKNNPEFKEEEYIKRAKTPKPKGETQKEFSNSMREFLNSSDEKQEEARSRLKVVLAYEERPKGQKIEEFIASLDVELDFLELTKDKIYRWKKKLDEARALHTSPLVAMLDNRGKKEGATKLTDEMQSFIERYILRRENKLRPAKIHEKMVLKFGALTPSASTVARYIEKYKTENAMLVAIATNPDKAKGDFMPAYGDKSERAKRRNQYVEMDSTPADVICSDGKRWVLTGAIDIFSRRVVFHLDQRDTSYSISRLLRKYILTMGVPETIVTDNGKNYTSKHFEDVCFNLHIRQERVPPFSGDAKPFIERVFRTISTDLFEELQGYIGHSVAEKTEIENRRGYQAKLDAIKKFKEYKKKEFEEAFSIKKQNIGSTIYIPMSSKELQEYIDKWNKFIYEQRPHGGLKSLSEDGTKKYTPMQKWLSNPTPVEGIADPQILDILLGESFKRTVNKKGITIEGVYYQNEDLWGYSKQKVYCMATDNLGYIRVYDLEWKPICVALNYEFLDKSREELKEAKKKYEKFVRAVQKYLNEIDILSELDPAMKDVIRHKADEFIAEAKNHTNKTYAIPKQTEIIKAVKEGEEKFKEESKKEEKLINKKTGRPLFDSLFERFMWCLENNEFNENDKKHIAENKQLFKEAKEEYEFFKSS